MTCEARRCNDQMQCGQCGTAWDIDDQDPPRCGDLPPLPLTAIEKAREALCRLSIASDRLSAATSRLCAAIDGRRKP